MNLVDDIKQFWLLTFAWFPWFFRLWGMSLQIHCHSWTECKRFGPTVVMIVGFFEFKHMLIFDLGVRFVKFQPNFSFAEDLGDALTWVKRDSFQFLVRCENILVPDKMVILPHNPANRFLIWNLLKEIYESVFSWIHMPRHCPFLDYFSF